MPTQIDPKNHDISFNPSNDGSPDSINKPTTPTNNNESLANGENQYDKAQSNNSSLESEKSFFKPDLPTGGLKGKLVGKVTQLTGTKKVALFGGGAVAAVFTVIIMFNALAGFQLIHLGEMLDLKFNGQTRRILNRRALKHYQIIFDEEGRGYYNKTGFGRVTNMYSEMKPEKIVADLKSKGYDISVGKDGKLSLNGEVMTGKISDRRNKISTILREQYPDDGFVKRNRRSVATYKTFGIKRVFFENTKEKIDNWELEYIKRIREKVKPSGGGVSNSSATKDGDHTVENTDGTTTNIPGLDSEDINSQASEQAQKLQDPKYNPEIDPSAVKINTDSVMDGISKIDAAAAGKAVIGSAPGATANALKINGAADAACEIKAYGKAVELGAKAYRYRALIEYATPILVASHQMKTGKGVTGEQVSGIMKILNRKVEPGQSGTDGIGSSGAMQLLSGNDTAKIKNTDRYALKFNSGAGGVLNKLNETADKIAGISGGTEYCKLSRNGWFQAGSIVVGVISAVIPDGVGQANLAKNIAGSLVASLITGVVGELVKPLLINAIAGNIINGYESGDKVGDALAGGSAISASTDRYKIGGIPKDVKQASAIENIIALEKKEDLKNESAYNKYLAISNPDSVAFATLMRMPNTPTQAFKSTIRNTASLLNPIQLLSKKAHAANELNGIAMVYDQMGIANYSMSDEDIDSLPDVIEAEKWIKDNDKVEDYQSWVGECHPKEGGDGYLGEGLPLSEEDEEKLKDRCTAIDKDDIKNYLANYLDRNISAGIAFNAKQSDCLDPDDDNWQCAFDDGSGNTKTDDCENSSSTTGEKPPEDYEKVKVGNNTISNRTKFMLDNAEKIFGGKIDITQGSYNPGGVAASGGTHDGGGAIDVSVNGLSSDKIDKTVEALRRSGFAAWHRTTAEGNWGAHIHALAIGDKEMADGAANQVKAFFAGGDGLGNDKDTSSLGTTVTPAWALEIGKEGGGNSSGTSGATSCSTTSGEYKDPHRDIKDYEPMRVDMGVDFGGTGPVYALGNGVVVESFDGNAGWPGGNFLSYKLTDGPAKDKMVFVAESCKPKVKVKDKVDTNTVVCELTTNQFPYNETGWAEGNGTWAVAHTCYNEGDQTAYGENFHELLKKLGGKGGAPNPGANKTCKLPSDWPKW